MFFVAEFRHALKMISFLSCICFHVIKSSSLLVVGLKLVWARNVCGSSITMFVFSSFKYLKFYDKIIRIDLIFWFFVFLCLNAFNWTFALRIHNAWKDEIAILNQNLFQGFKDIFIYIIIPRNLVYSICSCNFIVW